MQYPRRIGPQPSTHRNSLEVNALTPFYYGDGPAGLVLAANLTGENTGVTLLRNLNSRFRTWVC